MCYGPEGQRKLAGGRAKRKPPDHRNRTECAPAGALESVRWDFRRPLRGGCFLVAGSGGVRSLCSLDHRLISFRPPGGETIVSQIVPSCRLIPNRCRCAGRDADEPTHREQMWKCRILDSMSASRARRRLATDVRQRCVPMQRSCLASCARNRRTAPRTSGRCGNPSAPWILTTRHTCKSGRAFPTDHPVVEKWLAAFRAK